MAAAQTGCQARGVARAGAARLPLVGRIRPLQLRRKRGQNWFRSSALQPGSSDQLAGLSLPASARGGESGSEASGGTTSGPSVTAGTRAPGVAGWPDSGGISEGVEHAARRTDSTDRLRMRFMS